jgi:hypothetical protein
MSQKPVTEEAVDKFIRALRKIDPTMKADPPRAVVRLKLEQMQADAIGKQQGRKP